MNQNRKICCSTVCGGISLALGILFLPMTIILVDVIAENQVLLIPGSIAYPIWRDVPVPFYFQFWVWDLKNPDEFLLGAKPILEQKGPYTWDEYRPKDKDSLVHNDNGTVTFRNKKSFFFNREMSVGDQTDMITTINVPVFTVASVLQYQPRRRKNLWNVIHRRSGAQPVVNITVEGLIWGYEDNYLELAQDLLGEDLLPTTKFGFFLGQNNSDDGLWNVFTGETDIDKVNLVDKWNGMSELPYWTTPGARMMNGSDGTLMHPFVKKEETFYAFIPASCRSGALVYESTGKYNRIKVWHFVQPDWLFASPDIYPPNVGFCTPDEFSCPPSGLNNVTECYFHAPVFLSSPHFLYAEQSVLDMVEGMSPNKEEHEISVDVDPLSGATLKGDIRGQVNVFVRDYDFVSGLESIPTAYFPVLWQNESAGAPASAVGEYYRKTRIPLIFVGIITGLLLAAGIGLVIWLGCMIHEERKQEKQKSDIKLVGVDNPTVQKEENKDTKIDKTSVTGKGGTTTDPV